MAATPRTRLDPDARRAELIEFAAALFAARPFDTVRFDEVADLAGCSRALLYHYFPNKRALFLAVVEDVMADVAWRTEPGELPPVARLRSGLREYFLWARENAAKYQVAVRAGSFDHEVKGLWDQHRARQARRVLRGMPEELQADRMVMLIVRSWITFTVSMCLDWIDNPREVSIDRLTVVCVTTLVTTVQSASVPAERDEVR